MPESATVRRHITSPGGILARIEACQQRIEQVLERCLANEEGPTARLTDAMRYSVLGGGKRLRPVLVYLTGESCGAASEVLDPPAAAVELIHSYSLVHDDLPAMDDDDLRRGRPSCHRAYDEGTAVLAGDALQALAFGLLGEAAGLGSAQQVRMLCVLARAIGTDGMAGGQAIDLAAAGRGLTPAAIEGMHRRKTGALIQASVELGALAAGLQAPPVLGHLRRYGAELGLAFQIQDDILDVTGDTHVIGKRQGADAAHGKPTYPSVFGLERARSLAALHRDQALAALDAAAIDAPSLAQLAYYVVERAS